MIDMMPSEQGQMIMQGKAHGMVNTLIIPAAEPNNWFFLQFPTQDAAEQFALDNALTIRDDKDD